MAQAMQVFDKLLDFLSDKPASLYKIVYHTRFNARTIKRYLAIIEKIQGSKKIVKITKGSRVYYLKE